MSSDDAASPSNDNSINSNGASSVASAHGKPYDGMCCLCTMEDITIEDGNYGTSVCTLSLQCSVLRNKKGNDVNVD